MLSDAALVRPPPGVRVPRYDRTVLRPGIVHIGLGNFHRTHQAWYLHRLLDAGLCHDWAIIGAGVRPADVLQRERLLAQDCLTTLIALDPSGKSAEALPLLQLAVKSRPDIPMGPLLLGRALANTRQFDEARRLFTALAPAIPVALLDLARLEAQTGNTAAAKAHLATAIEKIGPQVKQVIARDVILAPLLSSP